MGGGDFHHVAQRAKTANDGSSGAQLAAVSADGRRVLAAVILAYALMFGVIARGTG
jgi:hypothetical protein